MDVMKGTRRRSGPPDLTVVAIPFYFGSMAAEYLWLRRRAATRGTTAADYEWRDTVASLTMGVGSLVVPLLAPRLLEPLTPGRGRFGRVLVRTALAAAALTTAADHVARRSGADTSGRARVAGAAVDTGRDGTAAAVEPQDAAPGARARAARRVAAVGGVATVVAGGLAATTTWASRTTPRRFWRHRVLPDLGFGPVALALAVVGWDFVYYWNHRLMHESRYMWAVHVVHHSSEHYNLSTALRQPVADALGTTIPYGALCLLGISPELVATARGINLLYQFWIHTETIGRLGAPEAVLNTPSHHRVHHGSNRRYLDRNHGSILIVWDRLFGTFEPEGEEVVYGLTKNIGTFNPGRVAAHEHLDMLRDVARSTSWRERASYVVRGPGWADRHRAEVEAETTARAEGAPEETARPAPFAACL
jgi:sterol desaturase/sphingolipid hydroxylase (fatty acid hydroxylase superfamily)